MEVLLMVSIGLFVVCTSFLPMIIAARRGLEWLPLYILGNVMTMAGIFVYPLYTTEGVFSVAGWTGVLLCSFFQKDKLNQPTKLPEA